jgi:hypothetical protein
MLPIQSKIHPKTLKGSKLGIVNNVYEICEGRNIKTLCLKQIASLPVEIIWNVQRMDFLQNSFLSATLLHLGP